MIQGVVDCIFKRVKLKVRFRCNEVPELILRHYHGLGARMFFAGDDIVRPQTLTRQMECQACLRAGNVPSDLSARDCCCMSCDRTSLLIYNIIIVSITVQ